MFFTDQLVEYIVQETNRYAKQKHATWQETNPDEFRVFLGLLQLQGIVVKPHFWHYKEATNGYTLF